MPAPKLPAGRRWSTAERKVWDELWGSPQASQWDDAAAGVVGAYVVHLFAVLGGTASAWQAQELRHTADRLGLTPSGQASLGWRIAEPGESADVVPIRGGVA